jgi:uncharacterized protein (DUF305 family)
MALNAEDVKFMKMMIPHHRDAVKMARREIERGYNEEVKKIALDIFNGQMQEIYRFEKLLKDHGYSTEMDMNERMRM